MLRPMRIRSRSISSAWSLLGLPIARGEVVVSLRDAIGALCGPGQARRVARYLAERGHVESRGDLIRIRVAAGRTALT